MSKIATPNQRKAKLCANDTSTTDNTSNSYKTFCCSFDAILDGNVGFVTAGCTFAANLKHQKGIFRRNRQINHRIALHPENVRKYKQKRSVRL